MAVQLHQRTVIRHAVRALLLGTANARPTAAKDRVSTTRKHPYRKNDLPAISVYTLEETIDEASDETAGEPDRDLDLDVVGFVVANEDVDDALDALAFQMELAMAADRTLGNTAAKSRLSGTTMGFSGEGETLTGMVTLTYAVTYQQEAAAATDLDEFLVAGVETNLGGAQDEEDATLDEIDVRPEEP